MRCQAVSKWLMLIPSQRVRGVMVESHERHCAKCQQADEAALKSLLQEDAPAPIDLWPSISKELTANNNPVKPLFPSLYRWLGAGVAAAMILLLLLRPDSPADPTILPLTPKHLSTPLPLIHNLRIMNQPARAYYYQSQDAKRLIVWAAQQTLSFQQEKKHD